MQDDALLGSTGPKSFDEGAPVAASENPACGSCGGPHRFDTSVPSVLWNRVIRGQGLPDYLCTSCVVRAFAAAGESFTAELYGDGFSGLTIDVRVNGRDAKVAEQINEQNNVLRFAISEAARILSEAHRIACEPQHPRRDNGDCK